MVAKPRRPVRPEVGSSVNHLRQKESVGMGKKCSYASGPLSPHYSLLALAAAKACSIELWAGDCFLIPARSTKLQLCYLGSEPLALG